MSLKPTLLLAAAAVAGSLVVGPRVFAQPAQSPSSPPYGQGMMEGRGMMGRNGMSGMMGRNGMSGMMGEMSRMAGNCNRMMESMNTGRSPNGPGGNAQPMMPRG